MATNTTYFNLIKPAYEEDADVADLNVNADRIDNALYNNRLRSGINLANIYDASESYAVDDYCVYLQEDGYRLYKCIEATTGAFDPTKWDEVMVTEELGQGGGGSSTLAGLNDVDISSPANNQVLRYNSTTGKWENQTGGTGGGHTIVDGEGTALTQRNNLQFTDAHTSDDSTGNTTKVEIAKQVTTQEWESATEQGFYLIKDDDDYLLDISQVANADAEHLPYSDTQSTKEKIDEVSSSDVTELSFTPVSTVTVTSTTIKRDGRVIMCLLRLDITNISNNTETKIGELSGFSSGQYISGAVVSASNTRTIGSFVLSGRNLYCRLLSDATATEKGNVSISVYSID